MTEINVSTRRIAIFISFLLMATGLLASFAGIRTTNATVTTEHDKHLDDLTSNVDTAIYRLFSQSLDELSYIAGQPTVQEAETDYQKTGDLTSLKEQLSQYVPVLADFFLDFCIIQDGNTISSVNGYDMSGFTFLAPVNDNGLYTIMSPKNEIYFLLTTESGNPYLEYGALFSSDALMNRVVSSTQYGSYWMLLFDPSSDLYLEASDTSRTYRFLSEEEALERNDGFSLILKNHEKTETVSVSYSYISSSHQEQSARAFIIPDSVSKNGHFAIMVTVSTAVLFSKFNDIAIGQFCSSLLFSFGVAILFFFYMSNAKLNNELTKRVEALAEENRLREEILQKQKDIVHRQRMEIMGQMTTGIAHEFNNLLTPIMGYSMMLLDEQMDDTSESYNATVEIYQAAVRAKGLVSRISKLSGKNADDSMHFLSENALVENTLKLTAPSKPKNVEIRTHLSSSAYIYGNEAQLSQLLINLLINAYQAFDGKDGVITIETTDLEKEVRLVVSDNGPGIPKEYLDKIYNPFFTTKEAGKGTGLGLAIVHQAVVDHNGRIDVETETGKGTSFVITLPIAEKKDPEDE